MVTVENLNLSNRLFCLPLFRSFFKHRRHNDEDVDNLSNAESFDDGAAGQHSLVSSTKYAAHENHITPAADGLRLSRDQFSFTCRRDKFIIAAHCRDALRLQAAIRTKTKRVVRKRHQNTTVGRLVGIAMASLHSERSPRMFAIHVEKKRPDVVLCRVSLPVAVAVRNSIIFRFKSFHPQDLLSHLV